MTDAIQALTAELVAALAAVPADTRPDVLNDVRAALHTVSPQAMGPVDCVRWVPCELVQANDYNPNSVARHEMTLLLRSISHDGYTQPIVAIWDPEVGKYIVVDGFHRSYVMGASEEIRALYGGRLPIVVLEKSINDRMASTVRHNRARGKHSTTGMANMIFAMLDNGMQDHEICNELGLEVEELIRLKHMTGFSKLFKDTAYNRAWVTRSQVRTRLKRLAEGPRPGDAVTDAPVLVYSTPVPDAPPDDETSP